MTLGPLRIGTRGSPLARWQAYWVADRLRDASSGRAVELVEITTTGDRFAADHIGKLVGRGVFTREIQHALARGEVDVAVHSMKDLPTQRLDGLRIAAVPPRGPVEDVLALPADHPHTRTRASTPAIECAPATTPLLPDLPQRARVATGSLRRRAQLLHARPDLELLDIRGNVETRLRKLDEGRYDAVVLARAGLQRLGLAARATYVLGLEIMLPAVGQGALALECRDDDEATASLLAPLDDPATRACVTAERALLAELEGGCLAPIAALARPEGDRLRLDAVVLTPDGSQRRAAHATAPLTQPDLLGRQLAQALRAQGADQLVRP